MLQKIKSVSGLLVIFSSMALSSVALSGIALSGMAHGTENDKLFYTLGFSLTNENGLALPQNTELDSQFIPLIELGVGMQIPLSDAWVFSPSITLSQTLEESYQFTQPEFGFRNVDISNTGVWVDSKLAYTALSKHIRPFIDVGVGQVYGRYTDNGQTISSWETGVRAFVGVEFDVTKDSKISFAFGTSDISDLN